MEKINKESCDEAGKSLSLEKEMSEIFEGRIAVKRGGYFSGNLQELLRRSNKSVQGV